MLSQHVGDRFDDRRMVIGDKAGRHRRPLRHGALGCRVRIVEWGCA
jgi:hypothetical protein